MFAYVLNPFLITAAFRMKLKALMNQDLFPLVLMTCIFWGLSGDACARKKKSLPESSSETTVSNSKKSGSGFAEARLIEIYQLTSKAQAKEALAKAESLVRDYPNFQLAQLVYGDLLAARVRPLQTLGDVPSTLVKDTSPALIELRDESHMRLKALRERPPSGSIPSQFLALSSRNKHAIAVDASRARLYLFENNETGLKLVADYYISVGKSGLEKNLEGDLRTPLGIYFITSNLDPKSLKDFYGSGALPINYPNVLDNKRGKTGKGIWLHGTPPGQFSRPPLATDGCVVLANPDLLEIIKVIEVRTTPVVIAQRLQWVTPTSIRTDSKPFETILAAWQSAKSSGNMEKILAFYSADFNSAGKTLPQWTTSLRMEMDKARGRSIQLKDVSYLRWTDSADTMVVTFGEVTDGTRAGPTKRQYWSRQGSQWKIFFEGVIG
jgi:L,D-transpeptidase YnhG